MLLEVLPFPHRKTPKQHTNTDRMWCVCVCVCACVRACVCACVHVCLPACVRVFRMCIQEDRNGMFMTLRKVILELIDIRRQVSARTLPLVSFAGCICMNWKAYMKTQSEDVELFDGWREKTPFICTALCLSPFVSILKNEKQHCLKFFWQWCKISGLQVLCQRQRHLSHWFIPVVSFLSSQDELKKLKQKASGKIDWGNKWVIFFFHLPLTLYRFSGNLFLAHTPAQMCGHAHKPCTHALLCQILSAVTSACLQSPLHVCSHLYMSAVTSACLQSPLHVCSHLCMSAVTSACLQSPLHVCSHLCMSAVTSACLQSPLHVCSHLCMSAVTSACLQSPLHVCSHLCMQTYYFLF